MGGVQPICNIKASTLSEINAKTQAKPLYGAGQKVRSTNSLLTTAVDENERVFHFYLKPNERFGQLNT